MTPSELNQFLRHILTIIMTIEKYPQDVIDEFCKAFYDAAKNQPEGSPFQA